MTSSGPTWLRETRSPIWWPGSALSGWPCWPRTATRNSPPGIRSHVWLADLIRLPSVSSLRLDRMSRDETEQQMSLLLGGQADPHLVSAVVRRSDGNPYFSELLVQGVTAADQDLPADLPAELTGALLAAWHRLAARPREVMRLLAVGGRPASVDDLVEVAAARGIGAEAVTVALVEATKSGICVAQGAEMCWFRHPLLAEVLNATFVPGEAVPIHAAWAKTLESRAGTVSMNCAGGATSRVTTKVPTIWKRAWRRRCAPRTSPSS